LTPTAFLEKWRATVSGYPGDVPHAAVPQPHSAGVLRWLLTSYRGSGLLLIVCILVAITAFNYAQISEKRHAHSKFLDLATHTLGSVSLCMGAGAHIRPGLGSLEFEAYVEGWDSKGSAPKIKGIGFVRLVDAKGDASVGRPTAREKGHAHERSERMIFPCLAFRSAGVLNAGMDLAAVDTKRPAFALARSSPETVIVQSFPRKDAGTEAAGFFAVKVGFFPQAGGSGTVAKRREADPDGVLFSSTIAAAEAGAFTPFYTSAQNESAWLLAGLGTPTFEASYIRSFPYALFALGVFFAVLVWWARRSMASRQSRRMALAQLLMQQPSAGAQETQAQVGTNSSVVMVLDGDARIVFANEAAAALFGLPRAAFKGCSFDKFVKLRRGAQNGTISNAEGILASGARLMLDVQINTWNAADDKVQTAVLIRDVTEQINGRRAIERLHRRYDIALNGANIGIFEIDLVTGEAEMSETWHRIMGTDGLGEAFDHRAHFLARVHPDDLAGLIEADRRCINGEAPRSVAEYRFRFGDTWRWMYSDAVPSAQNGEGRATGLIGTQSDITSLRHARNALELSEARFRMVLEDAPVGMAVMDEAGTFITVNSALSTLSGYEVDVLDKKMRLSHLLSRKDFVTLSRDVRGLLKSDQSKTYQNQFRLCTRSGEKRWGLFNVSWTFDKNRAEYVYIAQIIDITDQKRVEQMKSEFVATVSHELRTPLTSIKGALSLLNGTARSVLSDKARRLLDIATTNVERLTEMVNDILDLERIASGEVVFELENLDLHDLAAQVSAELASFADAHNNTVNMTIPRNGLCVLADAARLRQVLLNLLSNACKFSDPDTPIVIRHDRRDEEVVVYVENIGTPVPESFHKEIFGAFTQVDGSDTRIKGGTGLGLNIARQIVIRLGGEIGFEQFAGRRTVFWFTCPIATSHECDIVQVQNAAG